MTGRRQAVLDQVKAKYPKLHTIQSDVSDAKQIVALATRVKADFLKLDVLMNNAGILLYKNLKSPAADLSGLMSEMNINVGGVVGTTSALIDVLKGNNGTVINVSSSSGFLPSPYNAGYAAAKAHVLHFSEALNAEVKGSGVTVTALISARKNGA